MRQHAPATQRNRQPILDVLQRVLPPTGTVLEIGSGTGEHSIFFAPQLQPRRWWPSDCNETCLASIRAWQEAAPASNLEPPLYLDVCQQPWPLETGDRPELATDPLTAIVSINTIHIAPWEATLGLLAGAGRLLPPEGVLYLYGPFKRSGEHTAPSNVAFDQWLRSQDTAWGVRDLEAVAAAAAAEGLAFVETVAMPANNFSVVFRRSS